MGKDPSRKRAEVKDLDIVEKDPGNSPVRGAREESVRSIPGVTPA
jgi:hypothetical protein